MTSPPPPVRALLHALDLPPVWLAGALGLAWGLDRLLPGLETGHAGLTVLGQALIAAGLVAMGLGLVALLRHRTSFVPRQQPRALVKTGIFRLTRNPIYLGDVLVLSGAIFAWDVLPALLLVPLFVAVITKRFIHGEEAALRARFGAAAETWLATTRRWV